MRRPWRGRGGFLSRLAGSLAWGIVKGVAYYFLIVYVSPRVSVYLYQAVAAEPVDVAPPLPSRALLAAGFLFIGISVAASALRDTIAAPLLRAVSAVLAFIFVFLILWDGKVEASLEEGGVTVYASLDLGTIIAVYFVFITVPGVILPLVWLLLEKASRGTGH